MDPLRTRIAHPTPPVASLAGRNRNRNRKKQKAGPDPWRNYAPPASPQSVSHSWNCRCVGAPCGWRPQLAFSDNSRHVPAHRCYCTTPRALCLRHLPSCRALPAPSQHASQHQKWPTIAEAVVAPHEALSVPNAAPAGVVLNVAVVRHPLPLHSPPRPPATAEAVLGAVVAARSGAAAKAKATATAHRPCQWCLTIRPQQRHPCHLPWWTLG